MMDTLSKSILKKLLLSNLLLNYNPMKLVDYCSPQPHKNQALVKDIDWGCHVFKELPDHDT